MYEKCLTVFHILVMLEWFQKPERYSEKNSNSRSNITAKILWKGCVNGFRIIPPKVNKSDKKKDEATFIAFVKFYFASNWVFGIRQRPHLWFFKESPSFKGNLRWFLKFARTFSLFLHLSFPNRDTKFHLFFGNS